MVTEGELFEQAGTVLQQDDTHSLVVIDGDTDGVLIATELLVHLCPACGEPLPGCFCDPDPTRCEACGELWEDCRCPDECQEDHSGPAGSCPGCGR